MSRAPGPAISLLLRPCLPFLAAFLLALPLVGCQDPEPIRIGFIGGLSGRTSDLGIAGHNGARLAVEECNRTGGLHGRAVELLARDDRQDPDQARLAAQDLIEAKVAAVIGPMTSQIAEAILPQFERADRLLLSPTVSTTNLSGHDDQFLRVYPASRLAAAQLAGHAYHARRLRRLQVIYDTANLSHSEAWFRQFEQKFTQAGGTIGQVLRFHSGSQTSFTDLAGQLARSEGDGLLVIAGAMDTAMLCLQLRHHHDLRPVLATEWSGTADLLRFGKTAVDGLQFFHSFDRDSRDLAYLSFRERYIDRFGVPPDFAAVHAYDATSILLEGLRDHRPEQLKQALLAKGTFIGLQGPVSFDRYGDIDRELFLITVEDHQFRTHGPVAAADLPSPTDRP